MVIGLGLIGGSLAKAARERGLCSEVIGVARRAETCEQAVALGVVDRAVIALDQVSTELADGDVVMIAVPTLAVAGVLAEVAEKISPEVTITDGASVKGSVVDAARDAYGELPSQFVPGHPIAGSEQSGVTAANAELYINHKVILTPLPETGSDHYQRVLQLWQAVGAEVHDMPVVEHDEVLAATSHLPHMLAYTLVDTLAGMRENREIFRYAAGGFRDFTRIAGSDPVMWHDIALANRQALLTVLDELTDHVGTIREAIEQGNGDYLMDVFSRARDARNHFTQMLESKQK